MRVLVAALLLLLAVAPAARADTIVFRRGADIWRMAPDGSGQVALTGGERRYEWPSAADDGTIVASDETGRLYRLSRDDVEQGEPIPTAATVATEDAPAETPTHVRISPDGARIAYDEGIDGDVTTL
jgi:Tol biopolymer transport system component